MFFNKHNPNLPYNILNGHFLFFSKKYVVLRSKLLCMHRTNFEETVISVLASCMTFTGFVGCQPVFSRFQSKIPVKILVFC